MVVVTKVEKSTGLGTPKLAKACESALVGSLVNGAMNGSGAVKRPLTPFTSVTMTSVNRDSVMVLLMVVLLRTPSPDPEIVTADAGAAKPSPYD